MVIEIGVVEVGVVDVIEVGVVKAAMFEPVVKAKTEFRKQVTFR